MHRDADAYMDARTCTSKSIDSRVFSCINGYQSVFTDEVEGSTLLTHGSFFSNTQLLVRDAVLRRFAATCHADVFSK